jgi:hypothetical protein
VAAAGLGAAGLAAGLVVGLSGGAAPRKPSPQTRAPADCRQEVVRPRRIVINCAKGEYLSDIQWSTWGRRGASGFAMSHSRNCKPDCAHGRFYAGPVDVELSAPRYCSGARATQFGRIKVTSSSTGLTQSLEQPLNCPPT